jgi:uncharacterized protein involved in exopolysaccharide biosynthesis
MTNGTSEASDEIDLLGLTRTLVARWWWPVLGAIVGAVGAVLVLWLVPAKFEGSARVLIRTALDPAAGLRSRLGPIAELAPSALGGGKAEEIDTELEILASRTVIGAVVDSLRLQVRMLQPARRPPAEFIDSVHLVGRFTPRVVELHGGVNVLPEGTIWVRPSRNTALHVRIYDREESIDNFDDALEVKQRGGDVVGIRYRANDSLTVAEAPNLLVTTYLARRRTVDRGVNQRRLEFLMSTVDSVESDLRDSGRELRTSQEKEGLVDPAISGKALLDQFALLEGTVSQLRAEEQSLDTILSASTRVGFDPRRLAGFPALLKSPAINELVNQLSNLQLNRGTMLGRLTADAAEVRALNGVSDSLTRQLLPLAQTYRESLRRQREALAADVTRLRVRLEQLPRQAEALQSGRTAVERLTRLDLGMGSQVLEARLAAITEGGDVRILDAAVPPRKVAFPRTLMTLAIGVAAGLALGVILALLTAAPASRRAVP